jgi:hypothetical protein
VIFVNTSLQRPGLDLLIYHNAEIRAEMYRELYEKVFGYDKVEIFFNLTRDEMISKLNELADEAKVFSQNHAERTILALDVIYIGFKLSSNYHLSIL